MARSRPGGCPGQRARRSWDAWPGQAAPEGRRRYPRDPRRGSEEERHRMTASVDVSDLYRMEPEPALVPHRFRRPLHLVLDGAVPGKFESAVGPWLHAQRLSFYRAGDEEGQGRFAWEFDHVDQVEPELFAQLRAV